VGVKLYPAGATTNSDRGIVDLGATYDVLEAMQRSGLPLLVHGESIDPSVDVFDREARFVADVLAPLVERFDELKIVLEHVTTREAVDFVSTTRRGVAATITAHHLLHDRNALFRGGLRPDLYCLPVLKRATHQRALVEAATSGNPRFFLGTDSAPHPRRAKHSACGCAGIYTAHAALELYATAFERAGALERLEAFASHHGADFYGLPRNQGTVELIETPWRVPSSYRFGDDELSPLGAGETLGWQLVDARVESS
jgi:dihydroorotase